MGEQRVKSSLIFNLTAAFAPIDNLKIIDYNFSDTSYKVKRELVKSSTK